MRALLPKCIQPRAQSQNERSHPAAKGGSCQECLESAREKRAQITEKLRVMKLPKAANLIEEKMDETLTSYKYPASHWTRIKTNNPLERIMHEIRRRTRVVSAFPDGNSALMLVGARLRHIAGTKWGTRRYLRMELLEQQINENQLTA